MRRFIVFMLLCIIGASVSACGNGSSSPVSISDTGSFSSKSAVGGGIDSQAPTPPTGLKASVMGPYQINLSWTASTDNIAVVTYKIYRDGTLFATQAATSTSYSDTDLADLKTYTYTISACDLVGNCSSQSDSVSATTTAASINGIWTNSKNGYLLLLKDYYNPTTVALEIPPDFSTLKIWVGTGSNTEISLADFINSSNTLVSTIASNNMNGTRTVAGVPESYNANLTFAYVGGIYDGIWQMDIAPNSYLAYLTANVSGKSLAIVVGIVINSDKTVSYDILAGAESGGVFNGASLLQSSKFLKLNFFNTSSSGVYSYLSNPPSTLNFTATQIFALSR